MDRRTKAIRRIGVVMVITSCVLAFAWYYWLVPYRCLRTFDWYNRVSQKEAWEVGQKRIHRFGADHDTSIMVADYGDKKWVEWTIEKLNAPGADQLGSCGEFPYHLPDGLCDMTNQRITNSPSGWLGWWLTNKDKTQVEWVRDGFAQKGIELHLPLTTNDIITLLGKTNPTYIVYNARRWLRDSGFRPENLRFEDIPDPKRDAVLHGLVRYAEWYGENWDAPGKLALREPITGGFSDPKIESGLGKAIVASFIFGLAGTGVVLFRYGRKKTFETTDKNAV